MLTNIAKAVFTCKKTRAVAPRALANNTRNICPTFKNGRQEDAHEFVRALLDCMTRIEVFGCGGGRESTVLSWSSEKGTDVHRVFGGVLQSRVTCSNCKHVSVTTEPFLDLSLEIARVNSLERAMGKFTAEEVLDGDNKYRCEKCRLLVSARKRFAIRRAPNVLTLHLKRFDRNRKDGRFVQYPQTFDLGKYMFGRPGGGSVKYFLSGVLIHQGNARQCGHYLAYVRGGDGTWCLKDDSTSRQVPLKTVLGQKAYLLFYTRVQANRSSGAGPSSSGAGVLKGLKRKDGEKKSIAKAGQKKDTHLKDSAASPAKEAPKKKDGPKQKQVKSVLTSTVPPSGATQKRRSSDVEMEDDELELSEESSSEDDSSYRPSPAESSSNESESASEQKKDGRHDSPTSTATAEFGKSILKGPVKALASLTGKWTSQERAKSDPGSPMRKLLAPMSKHFESRQKSNGDTDGVDEKGENGSVESPKARTEDKAQWKKPVVKDSFVTERKEKREPEAKMSPKKFLGTFSRKSDGKQLSHPAPSKDLVQEMKAEVDELETAKRTISEPTLVPKKRLGALGKRFESKTQSNTEQSTGKKNVLEVPQSVPGRRMLGPVGRRTEARMSRNESSGDSEEDTIPSEPTSSADDEDDVPFNNGNGVREVLIGGGSAVQKVLRRVFGRPQPQKPEKKRTASEPASSPVRVSTDASRESQGLGESPKQGLSPSREQRLTAKKRKPESPVSRKGSSSVFRDEGVDTWDDAPTPEQPVRSFTRSKIMKRRRANDTFDADYDRGKPKKARQRYSGPGAMGRDRNLFEQFSEKKRRRSDF